MWRLSSLDKVFVWLAVSWTDSLVRVEPAIDHVESAGLELDTAELAFYEERKRDEREPLRECIIEYSDKAGEYEANQWLEIALNRWGGDGESAPKRPRLAARITVNLVRLSSPLTRKPLANPSKYVGRYKPRKKLNDRRTVGAYQGSSHKEQNE